MNEKTLDEIVEMVRDGERPEYDDLRYAICALTALETFNHNAFLRLYEAEDDPSKKKIFSFSAKWQCEEAIKRRNNAGKTPPKKYIGWDNDPDNPDFLKRRKASIKIFENIKAKIEKES